MTQPWYRLYLYINRPDHAGDDAASHAKDTGSGLFGGSLDAESPGSTRPEAAHTSASESAAENEPGVLLGDSLFADASQSHSPAAESPLSGSSPDAGLGDSLFASSPLAAASITGETVAETLRALLTDQGFAPYDPFPGGTGTPPQMKEMVRMFVAPPRDEVICVIGDFPEDLRGALSQRLGIPVLAAWLTEEEGGFCVYHHGRRDDSESALAAYLREGETVDDLEQALTGQVKVPPLGGDQPVSGAGLPHGIRKLAQDKGLKPEKASKWYERMSSSLFGKLESQAGSSIDQEKARAIVSGGEHDLWNSLYGQRVRAIAELLDLPENWRLPALDTVRDAYHVHRLRQRSPRMPLMPGDQEMLRAVPDALDYLPVYMGRP